MSDFKFDAKYIRSRCDPFTVGVAYINEMAEKKHRAQLEQARIAALPPSPPQDLAVGSEAEAPINEGARQDGEAMQSALGDDVSHNGDSERVTPDETEPKVQVAPVDAPNDVAIAPPTAAAAPARVDDGAAFEIDDAQKSLAVRAEPRPSGLEAPALDGEISLTRRPRGRPFAKGQSGNPNGRPRGARNKATMIVEALFEDGAQVVGQKALELAAAGNTKMINAILSRLIPPLREATVHVEIPPLDSPTACRLAKAKFAEAAAAGAISSTEAARQMANVDAVARSFNGLEYEGQFEERMADLEMSRLLARYPHCRDLEVAVRRYFAFERALSRLKLSTRQADRLSLQYYDRLSDEAREIINPVEGEE